MVQLCCFCNGSKIAAFKTAYGDFLCEDCWDEYICTDEGRLEYLIGICKGEYSACAFDADFLCDVVESWKKNRDKLALPADSVLFIESVAKSKGLL